MSAPIWSLEYAGIRRPLQSWGIVRPKLSIANQLPDSLQFDIAGSDPSAEPLFPFETQLTLWRDEARFFSGVVTTLPTQGEQTDRQSYVVSGPWYYLQNIVFQQPRWVYVDPKESTSQMVSMMTTSAVLFQGVNGLKWDAGKQAQDAVDYAIAKGAPIARGTFDFTTDAPWEEALDITCAEAVQKCIRWTPDAVAYWDYSGEIPSLELKRRALLMPVDVDLSAGSLVTSWSVTPRNDLLARGVHLRFARTQTDKDGNQRTQYIDRTAGTADGGLRCPSFTIQLSGTGDDAEPVPNTLAGDLYSALSVLHWEGELVVNEGPWSCSDLIRPGNVLNLMGRQVAWETMSAVVQSVEQDLELGETRVTFGPAEQLGPQDLLDLLRFKRGDAGSAPYSRNSGAPSNPTPTPSGPPTPPSPTPGPNPVPAPGPGNPTLFQSAAIEVCEGGQRKTIWVLVGQEPGA